MCDTDLSIYKEVLKGEVKGICRRLKRGLNVQKM